MEVTYDGPEGAFITGGGKRVMFRQVGEYTSPGRPDLAHPQQAQPDILVDDIDAAEARALELDATRLGGGGEEFRVFADQPTTRSASASEHPGRGRRIVGDFVRPLSDPPSRRRAG